MKVEVVQVKIILHMHVKFFFTFCISHKEIHIQIDKLVDNHDSSLLFQAIMQALSMQKDGAHHAKEEQKEQSKQRHSINSKPIQGPVSGKRKENGSIITHSSEYCLKSQQSTLGILFAKPRLCHYCPNVY